MKYLIDKDGKRYCIHCKSYKCICLPEGKSDFDIIEVTDVLYKQIIDISDKCVLFKFKKQTLPNGKQIPVGKELMVPVRSYGIRNSMKKIAFINNGLLNKLC